MILSLEPLTYAERKCLELVARGRADDVRTEQCNGCQAIANNLLASACRKMMANTPIEAVARALKLGLIN